MTEIDLSARRRKFLLKWGAIGAGWIALYLLAFVYLIDKRPFVEWTLIKSGPQETKAEAQLIKMPDGQVFLMGAGGAAGSLLAYLKKQKIKDIDKLILTSSQPYFTSGLKDMLGVGVRIKEVLVPSNSLKSKEWTEIESQLKSKGLVLSPINLSQPLFQKESTRLEVIGSDVDSLALRLAHGKNSLVVGSGDPSLLGLQIAKLNCQSLKTDLLINYTELKNKEPYLDWVGCLKPARDLSDEKGTFKILLKGDSFKLKRR
jgi:hypothetical protein